MPLKGIPAIISPDLLRVLAQMGHGDEIVLADAHFPTSSVCASGSPQELRADGLGIPILLEAILKILPLDEYVDEPVVLMQQVSKDEGKPLQIWDKYYGIISKATEKHIQFGREERFQFYARAKAAFAIVHTGELSQYGNIILKKGIVSS